jgi:hypothetical protein
MPADELRDRAFMVAGMTLMAVILRIAGEVSRGRACLIWALVLAAVTGYRLYMSNKMEQKKARDDQ